MDLKPGQLYRTKWKPGTEILESAYAQYRSLYKHPGKEKILDKTMQQESLVMYLGHAMNRNLNKRCSKWHYVLFGEILGWVCCDLEVVE